MNPADWGPTTAARCLGKGPWANRSESYLGVVRKLRPETAVAGSFHSAGVAEWVTAHRWEMWAAWSRAMSHVLRHSSAVVLRLFARSAAGEVAQSQRAYRIEWDKQSRPAHPDRESCHRKLICRYASQPRL